MVGLRSSEVIWSTSTMLDHAMQNLTNSLLLNYIYILYK